MSGISPGPYTTARGFFMYPQYCAKAKSFTLLQQGRRNAMLKNLFSRDRKKY